MSVSVQCPNPDCRASFQIAPGDDPRFRQCPQCGWDLVTDASSDPVSTLAPNLDQVRALDGDQPPPTAPDPFVGETIAGRYSIVRILGKGGMGAVYLANDSRLGGRKVAVKVPTFFDDHDTAFLRRLEREAHIAAQFQHPNICPIFDFGTHNGRPFLVLAYIEGTSLAEHLSRHTKPFDVVQAVALVSVVAQALQEAHETGIIHRDLKPDNIMLTREGRPIVMDFGLAKRTDSGEKLTSAGKAFGTPAYMPLEQFQDVGAIDHRADIYSLGVTLYQLLTGRLPYPGTLYQIMGALLRAVPAAPPAELREEVDPELSTICLKAMARDTADRYGSMREFAEALRLWLTPETPSPSVQGRGVSDGRTPRTEPGARGLVSEAGPQPPRAWSTPERSARGRGVGRRILVALRVSGLVALSATGLYAATDIRTRAPVFLVMFGLTLLLAIVAYFYVEYFLPHKPIPEPPPPADRPPAPSPAKAPVSKPEPSALPLTWTSRSTGMTFALIPAGDFIMGSAGGDPDEKPPHPVKISQPFYLGVHEVTQGEYKQVMGKHPSWFSTRGGGKSQVTNESTDRHPVESVSWNDAVSFCNKLSERDGLKPYYRSRGGEPLGGDGYRLPTEAEWEYACRARTTTEYWFGDNPSKLHHYAWYRDNSNGKTHPVGRELQPNAFGLFDMHGNVWEWCWDGYDGDFYARSPVQDPFCPAQAASGRVFRGGSWSVIPRYARSANRRAGAPGNRSHDLGFRLARGQPESR
jgi:formylglycine-generating enzyme required for sulfatase activity/predicted Ser/Thr protein kinase